MVSVIGVQIFAMSRAATGPQLYATPATNSVAVNATIDVTVRANSGANAINSVQASLGYDPAQLQFVSIVETGPFSLVAATDTATPGRIRIARAIPAGGAPVSGDNAVLTVKLKVLAASGSAAISFDDTASLMVRGSDNTNVLTSSTGATFTIADARPSTSARMSLSPPTAAVASGSTFTVQLKENSGTTQVNSIQASIGYDPAQLQYVGMTEGSVFTTQAATDTATAGRVRLARAIPAGGGGVSGDNTIVTLTFKVLATSGTAAVTLDQASSFVVTSADNKNILTAVDNSALTVQSPSTTPTGTASLSLSPATGTFAQGSTVAVTVRANSGTAQLTTVQSVISYPQAQLEYVGVTENTVFSTIQRTKAENGVIDIIRGISGGGTPVTGTNPVVTLNFKVIGTGAAPLAFTRASAIYDNSGTGANVLDLSASQGANYTLGAVPVACTGVPTTPGTVTRTAATYTTISLSWTASTPASNCTLGGYKVFRNGTQVASVTNGATYQDTGLTAGRSYTYAIQAFDTANHLSSMSAASSQSTTPDDLAPTTPTGVTATASGSAAINLSWTTSNDLPNPGGSGVASYHVFRNNAAAPTYTVTNGTTFTDSNVTAGTTYTYTVRAVDQKGNASAPSNVVSATPVTSTTCAGSPTAPGGLVLDQTGLNSATFHWTASKPSANCTIAGYRIYQGTSLIGTVTSGTSYTATGLEPNTIYSFTVVAFDNGAHASPSSVVLSTTTAADTSAPTAPANATATLTSAGQITVSWTAATDNLQVTGYRIYRGGTIYRTVGTAQLSLIDTQVSPSTGYTYLISAIDKAGNESARTPTNPAAVTTPAAKDTQAPTAPGNLRIMARTAYSIAITWNASTDNIGVAGYHIYRDGVFLADSTSLSYTDKGLQSSTRYTYTVRAFDADANVSSLSSALQVDTLLPIGNPKAADLNGDGRVTVYDLAILLRSWWNELRGYPTNGKGDLNNDGRVNVYDFLILVRNWGARV
ncbi:MAG TPA: cohesin domain-containing protein [Candidatus Saccharimonadales bacterium]|nr:cohesin domain-containing protein [Candidatus Saccharimonadales bacterium]